VTRTDEPTLPVDGAGGGLDTPVTSVTPVTSGVRARASRRVAITTIDQAFASASNFAVGVVVAHIAGLAGLGAFAVAYTAWLALGTAHRALITDPMSIDNDAVHAGAKERLTAGVAAETALGLVAAAALVLVSIPLVFSGLHAFGIALLTLAPFLPFLLVQDYWRWVGFMQARPDRSLANDTVYNCVQALGIGVLIVAGARTPEVAIVAWGVGAAAGALYGLWQFSVRFTLRGGPEMIRSRWPMSKWLFAGGLASWGSAQAYPLLAGPGVGPIGLGGLKAAQNLMSGPTLVLIQAGGSIGLPEASRSLELGGWPRLRKVALWVSLAGLLSVGLVAALVFFEGGRILELVYGREFVKYTTTARIIAVAWLVQTLGLGPILVLKATKQARALFHIALTSVVAACILIPTFSFLWGVDGTAVALVVSAAVTAWVELVGYRRTARAFAADPYATFEREADPGATR
jgi:O-antigen/teichoic acid export membrane protein